eukprot:12920777-Prorocentrum_lima.AAC.1
MCQEGAAEEVLAALEQLYEQAEQQGTALSWELQETKVGRQHALRDDDTANISAHTLALDVRQPGSTETWRQVVQA